MCLHCGTGIYSETSRHESAPIADDCQIYTSVSAADSSVAFPSYQRASLISTSGSANRLRLNPAKTQIMWLGSSQQLTKIYIKDISILETTVLLRRLREISRS